MGFSANLEFNASAEIADSVNCECYQLVSSRAVLHVLISCHLARIEYYE